MAKNSLIFVLLFGAFVYLSNGSSRPCQSNDAFYFNVQPKGITVREGGRAFLECNVSNHCNIQFQWLYNDKPIPMTTRRYQNGSNLVITRVNRSLDSAEFHCVATLQAPTPLAKQSQPAVLSILWISDNASVSLASPSEEEILNGKATEIQLKCNVDGSDEPTIKWYLNGRKIKRTERVLPGKQHKLLIKSPSLNDNGVYSCEADNSAGTVRSSSNYVLTFPAKADSRNGVPKMLTLPENRVARLGDIVSFDCRYENADSVSWKKVDNEDLNIGVSTSDRIRQLSNGSLLLTDLKSHDSGTYECLGFGKNGIRQSYGAVLTIASLENFSPWNFEPSRDWYVVGQNHRFEVTCVPPKGFPEPIVYWMRNGEKLTNSGRIRVVDELRLIIEDAKQEDRGDYECVAENMAGLKKGSVKLYVSRSPEIYYHPGSLEVEEGVLALFECKFKGNEYPVTVVEWEKSGEPISVHHRDHRVKIFLHNGTLIIDHVTLNDQGDYQCVVKTGDQKPVKSEVAKLSVLEKLKFIPKPVDKKLEINTTYQIPCKASGRKTHTGRNITIRWYRTGYINREGNLIKESVPKSNFSPNIRDREGILSFHPVKFEDAGTYMCIAVSGQGIINETIKVEVYASPEFLQSPKNASVITGSDVLFHCVVRGEPNPTVQWYYESVPEADWVFNHTKFENNSIFLQNVTMEYTGKFICLAGNKGGFKRQEALLCVKSKDRGISSCGRHHTMISSTNYDKGIRISDNGIRISDNENERPADTSTLSASTIGIAAGSAAGYILLVLLLVVYCGYRRRRQRERKIEQPAPAGTSLAGFTSLGRDTSIAKGDHEILLSSRMSNGGAHGSHAAENGHCQQHQSKSRTSPTSSSSSLFDRLQFSRNNLEDINQLGSGMFGEVRLMKVVRSKNANELERPVVVKIFTSKEENASVELWNEIEMYRRLDHPNIIKLIGLCREKEPIWVVYEYLEYGNIKHYLQASRCFNKSNGLNSGSYPPPLRADQIIGISYQIAQGMEHLTNQRFVHKDLAARNVLLSSDLQPKITQLSLSNDQFVNEYYTYRNVVLPLRWMPDEAFFDDDFSMKSDVWSFGVLVWELYSLGELPYQTLNNDSVIEQLKRRELRLTPPGHVQPLVADLLIQCWSSSPKDRPTFMQIREALERVQVEHII